MTSIGSVGVGPQVALGQAVMAPRDAARVFHSQHGRMGKHSNALAYAFKEFIKARKYTEADAKSLQGILVQEYGLLGLAQRVVYD